MLALVPQCLLSSKSLPSLGLRLTLRSTGHFTACQVWAKIRAQTRPTVKCRLARTLGVLRYSDLFTRPTVASAAGKIYRVTHISASSAMIGSGPFIPRQQFRRTARQAAHFVILGGDPCGTNLKCMPGSILDRHAWHDVGEHPAALNNLCRPAVIRTGSFGLMSSSSIYLQIKHEKLSNASARDA